MAENLSPPMITGKNYQKNCNTILVAKFRIRTKSFNFLFSPHVEIYSYQIKTKNVIKCVKSTTKQRRAIITALSSIHEPAVWYLPVRSESGSFHNSRVEDNCSGRNSLM